MLPPKLQVFAAAALLLFLGWVVWLIRYHRLSLRESLSWLLTTLAALVVTIFPQLLRGLASALGIEVAANALFAFAFLYILANLLAMTIAVSNGATRVRRLTQECAILRAELEALRAKVERQPPNPGDAEARSSAE